VFRIPDQHKPVYQIKAICAGAAYGRDVKAQTKGAIAGHLFGNRDLQVSFFTCRVGIAHQWGIDSSE